MEELAQITITYDPKKWKLVPIDPTDEQLRLMLAARYPATFREHLRNPLNGPKSRVEAEMLIVEVTNQYKNALSAAPKPAGAIINEGTKLDGWIKCSERMPEHNQQVLTWNGQYKATDLCLTGRFLCLKPDLVTHWMPLPAAPKPESE